MSATRARWCCSTTRSRWPTRRRRSPRTRTPSAAIDITFTGQGRASMFGGEPDAPHETPGEEFAKGTTNSSSPARDASASATRSGWSHGFGLRDHSWGPRFWQAPWYYRWLTANVGKDFGFMGSRVARRDDQRHPGRLRLGGRPDALLRRARALDRVRGRRPVPPRDHGAAPLVAFRRRSGRFKGTVMNLIPLRNRRPDPDGNMLVTRISEGMTEWTLDEGAWATGCRSTSTRSSTAHRWVWPSS